MLKISYTGCVGLFPAILAQFTFEMRVAARNRKKISKTLYCRGSRAFKVIDVDIPKKLVASACYDKQHVCAYLQPFYARELVSVLAIVTLSVCPSVPPSGTTRYRFKISRGRDFGLLLYDSLVSLVFCDNISCYPVKGVLTNEGRKRGTPAKRRYSTAICSSNVKMLADRHRHAANRNKH